MQISWDLLALFARSFVWRFNLTPDKAGYDIPQDNLIINGTSFNNWNVIEYVLLIGVVRKKILRQAVLFYINTSKIELIWYIYFFQIVHVLFIHNKNVPKPLLSISFHLSILLFRNTTCHMQNFQQLTWHIKTTSLKSGKQLLFSPCSVMFENKSNAHVYHHLVTKFDFIYVLIIFIAFAY